MTCYAVYLESAEGGPWLGHVPSLPGCNARAESREEVLATLPGAIRAHHSWLRRHGEPAPGPEEPVVLEVAAEIRGVGPFRPGDAAALLPSDQEPVSACEMEIHFRLMDCSRRDLLALVNNLCDDFLDWQPDPDSLSLRQVLRHVGNAEEWYVSRLVPPDTLPAEWRDDEALALWGFLAMERRTALNRLRGISAEERAGVFYPTTWTRHPDEAWTLRKVLRRLLEHEREHTGQVVEILRQRRGVLLAELAAARRELLAALAALPTDPPVPVCGEWTARDVLGHVADWEWVGVEGLRLLAQAKSPLVELVTDVDAWNREHVAARRDQAWETVLEDLHAARQALVDALESIDPSLLGRRFSFPWGGEGMPVAWLAVYPGHDREHARELSAAAGFRGR